MSNFTDVLKYFKRQKSLISVMGIVRMSHLRMIDGKLQEIYSEVGQNIVTNEGLDNLLDIHLGGTAKYSTWYCGIYKSNVTPAAGDTAAATLGAAGTYGECQDADYGTPATNRPEWVDDAVSGQSITNAGTKASYTMAASITVYGAFIASSQAKTATTGTLFAAKKFAAARAVVSTDVLNVQYTISAASA